MKKQKENLHDKNTVRLPWQYLPQPHGGICPAGYDRPARAGSGSDGGIRRHQHGGDRESRPSRHPGEAAAGGNLRRAFPGDPEGKLHKLLDFCGDGSDVADPWYTGDFDATWQDVQRGCRAMMKQIEKELKKE